MSHDMEPLPSFVFFSGVNGFGAADSLIEVAIGVWQGFASCISYFDSTCKRRGGFK